jgi:hypothetical protein
MSLVQPESKEERYREPYRRDQEYSKACDYVRQLRSKSTVGKAYGFTRQHSNSVSEVCFSAIDPTNQNSVANRPGDKNNEGGEEEYPA